MNIKRGYKVELDLNNKQRSLCERHAGIARFAYNWGLSRKIEAYKAGERVPSAIDLHRELNTLKKNEFSWMYEVSKCAPQEALRDLDKAFANFFRRVKQKKQGKLNGKVGFPRFKKRKNGSGSFRLTGSIHVFEESIQLPRLGRLRLKERGYLPTSGVKILSATVSERAGRWFLSLLVEEEIPDPEPAQGEPVGVDLGVEAMATCSDGRRFENPNALKKELRRLKRLYRELSRRQKGSKNWEKTRKKIARLHYRIANIRKDALHKATTAIVAKTKPDSERPSVVAIEDLFVSGMLKNHHLALAICDVGFAEFRRQLEYKTEWFGEELFIADRFFPSSKLCRYCGCINEDLTLRDRIWVCACGAVLDRDLNAAINLRNLAVRRVPPELACREQAKACGEERLQASASAPRRSRNRTAT